MSICLFPEEGKRVNYSQQGNIFGYRFTGDDCDSKQVLIEPGTHHYCLVILTGFPYSPLSFTLKIFFDQKSQLHSPNNRSELLCEEMFPLFDVFRFSEQILSTFDNSNSGGLFNTNDQSKFLSNPMFLLTFQNSQDCTSTDLNALLETDEMITSVHTCIMACPRRERPVWVNQRDLFTSSGKYTRNFCELSVDLNTINCNSFLLICSTLDKVDMAKFSLTVRSASLNFEMKQI